LVQVARVGEKLHVRQRPVGAVLETLAGELHLLLGRGALHGGLFDALPDLAHGERPCGGELNQALFLRLELV